VEEVFARGYRPASVTVDGKGDIYLSGIDPVNGGYDHTFVVGDVGKMKRIATVVEPDSGRTLDVWSTEPGLQLFTANSLTGQAPRDVSKGGVPYPSRSAVCLEPMHYPDSPNRPEFPSTTLPRGRRTRVRSSTILGRSARRRARRRASASVVAAVARDPRRIAQQP
jgi:galactose mutarotase-like enzyme